MAQLLLLVVAALIVGAIGFGIAVLVSGADPGLSPAEPDGRAQPLPSTRPLTEPDLARVRFDTALRGYRMTQVDAALRRAAYDLGYKEELIEVLLAEVDALRAGQLAEADELRRTRRASVAGPRPAGSAGPVAVAGAGAAVPVDAVPVDGGTPGGGEPAGAGAGPADREPAVPGGDDRVPDGAAAPDGGLTEPVPPVAEETRLR